MTFLSYTWVLLRFYDVLDPVAAIVGLGAWPIAGAGERSVARALDRLPNGGE
jgi:hypothetical protein